MPAYDWFRQKSLSRYRASLCWGITLGLFLCVDCHTATGALTKQSPSPELRQPDGAQALASITVADGRLSVNLRQAELQEVLSRIGKEAGFSLKMASTARETISAQFTDMALTQGLRRLLRLASLSYAMIYEAKDNPGADLKELWVFSTGNEGAPDFPIVARRDEGAVTDPDRFQQESSTVGNPSPGLLRGQRPEAVAPPRENPFREFMSGQQPEPAAPPQPNPFLYTPNGQQPEVAAPSQPNPFLNLTPGQ